MDEQEQAEQRLLTALRNSNILPGDIERIAEFIEQATAQMRPGWGAIELRLDPGGHYMSWVTDSAKIRAKRAGLYPP